MNTDTCVDDNFNFYIALCVCVPLIIILLILLIISLSWQFCRRCRSRSSVRKPTTVEDDDQPSDHLEQMRLSRLNNVSEYNLMWYRTVGNFRGGLNFFYFRGP